MLIPIGSENRVLHAASSTSRTSNHASDQSPQEKACKYSLGVGMCSQALGCVVSVIKEACAFGDIALTSIRGDSASM